MKTKINRIDADYINVKNKCRTTVNKNYSNKNATNKFKKDILISEHSPIRLITVDWSWKGVKSWVATHLSRHKWECFIGTQRTDRTGIFRDVLPQGELVDMDGIANAQHLIDTARKRLCYQASTETRECFEDLKETLHKYEESKELADVMVPNCIYRAGCPEFEECGFWTGFKSRILTQDLIDIQTRYNRYNEEFYNEL